MNESAEAMYPVGTVFKYTESTGGYVGLYVVEGWIGTRYALKKLAGFGSPTWYILHSVLKSYYVDKGKAEIVTEVML